MTSIRMFTEDCSVTVQLARPPKMHYFQSRYTEYNIYGRRCGFNSIGAHFLHIRNLLTITVLSKLSGNDTLQLT